MWLSGFLFVGFCLAVWVFVFSGFLFDVNENTKVWYAVVNSMDLDMVGSYATGD
jgi:hypothetical protein